MFTSVRIEIPDGGAVMKNDEQYHRGPCPVPTPTERERVQRIIAEMRKVLDETKV